jgi:adenosylmethionine-8-amino-7-oxononanoate aminotransferase
VNFPWTMGFTPNLRTEIRVYARFTLDNYPNARIGLLYQNDESGKDYVTGLKQALGTRAEMLVSEATYDVTDPTVDSQVALLKAAGIGVLVDMAAPRFAAQVIRKAAELNWNPVHLLGVGSSSIGAVLVPARLDNAKGLISASSFKEAGDPTWADDPGMKNWVAFRGDYFPGGDRKSIFTTYAYSVAELLATVLEQYSVLAHVLVGEPDSTSPEHARAHCPQYPSETKANQEIIMTHILHRAANAVMPVAVAGKGVELFDRDGKTYLDASGGAAVSCLGHGHPDVLAAMHRQLDKLAYAHTGFFTTEVAEQLADRLIADAPAGLEHVYLVSGGSEAVEAALKMARQYFVETGQPQRQHIIARRQSYHGNTLGALATGGNQWRRAQFQPLLIETHHINPCYAYRHRHDGETDDAYAARAAQELEDKILELGGDRVIAFVAETVVGATAGAVPPVGDYFKRIRSICDRYGVLLILDEVMCGMGRTGTLHACEQDGIAPDLMAIAKGLGGGYQPIGAVLLSKDIFAAFSQGSGFFQHGHTYMGHPMAAAAGLAVQEVIRRDGLLARVVAMGSYLERRLHERFGNHHHVGDVRGRGLFRGIEFVDDRNTRRPFPAEQKLNTRIKREAMARGLMVYPMGGTVDGVEGDHVLLAPPFIVTEGHLDAIVERLGDSVDAAIASMK